MEDRVLIKKKLVICSQYPSCNVNEHFRLQNPVLSSKKNPTQSLARKHKYFFKKNITKAFFVDLLSCNKFS